MSCPARSDIFSLIDSQSVYFSTAMSRCDTLQNMFLNYDKKYINLSLMEILQTEITYQIGSIRPYLTDQYIK